MKYLYYPGCSLTGTAREYDTSTRAFMAAAGARLHNIPDWTCCGASAAEAVSALLSLVLPARILALAETRSEFTDILVPCSACYLNLKKVENKIRKDPDCLETINTILAGNGLRLEGKCRVRQLLDVVSSDIGAEKLSALRKKELKGISVAPYYGCQCLRPFPVFDDPEMPSSMTPLIEAAGANVFSWNMASRCCGASHMSTQPEAGMLLVTAILEQARGADAIVTVCPMCQMNLEAYQGKISRRRGRNLRISILYLPQLLGLSLGLSIKAVGLDRNLAITSRFRKKLGGLV